MRKPILIEIFVWSVILFVIFSIAIFSYSKIFVEPNVYTIEFKDIDGITKGSPVRFMGMSIGYVRHLKSKGKHINVQIIVTEKNMKIPNGTVARVEFYGLGGSKSIELMPPDGSCDVGILTGDTIRINDVAQEAISIVEFVEGLEKYIKGIKPSKMQNMLEYVSDIKSDKIKQVGNEFTNMEFDINKKIQGVKDKQSEVNSKIEKINENVEKINKFIKK